VSQWAPQFHEYLCCAIWVSSLVYVVYYIHFVLLSVIARYCGYFCMFVRAQLDWPLVEHTWPRVRSSCLQFQNSSPRENPNIWKSQKSWCLTRVPLWLTVIAALFRCCLSKFHSLPAVLNSRTKEDDIIFSLLTSSSTSSSSSSSVSAASLRESSPVMTLCHGVQDSTFK